MTSMIVLGLLFTATVVAGIAGLVTNSISEVWTVVLGLAAAAMAIVFDRLGWYRWFGRQRTTS